MAQASKGVFNELSCHSAVGVDGAVTFVERGEFNQLVHKHIALHRDAPLSQEDLDIACRHDSFRIALRALGHAMLCTACSSHEPCDALSL